MNTYPEEFLSVIIPFEKLFSEKLFSKPVFKHVKLMLAAAILAPGKRRVSALLRIVGLSREKNFHKYHRVLSLSCWSAQQSRGMTDAQFAISQGLSPATISNMRNGKTDIISEETLRKVWQAVKPAEWQMVATASYQTVVNACEDARQRQRMVAIIGNAGYGKTATLRHYARQRRNTFLIEAKESMKPKNFFRLLLKAMGLRFEGSIFEMIEKVAEELSRRPDSLLIVDEAGKLSHTLILYLHDLRNYTENSAGIVLAGVGHFQTNMEKALSRGKRGFEEFHSRVAIWQHLPAPTRAEKKAIAEANGVSDPAQLKEVQQRPNLREVFNAVNNLKYAHRDGEGVGA